MTTWLSQQSLDEPIWKQPLQPTSHHHKLNLKRGSGSLSDPPELLLSLILHNAFALMGQRAMLRLLFFLSPQKEEGAAKDAPQES